MTLAEEAAAGPRPKPVRHGKVRIWLDALPETERAGAEQIMADPAWSHAEARAVFARHGLDIAAQSLGTYRREHYGSR